MTMTHRYRMGGVRPRTKMTIVLGAAIALLGSTSAFAPITNLHDTMKPSSPNQHRHRSQFPDTPLTVLHPSSHSGIGTTSLHASPTAIDTSSLTVYLLETIISYGVPALFTVIVILLAAKTFRGPRSKSMDPFDTPNRGLYQNTVSELYEDLYDDGSKKRGAGASFLKMFNEGGGGKDPNAPPKNIGVPSREYLTVTSLNAKYSSYEYTLTKAIDSKSRAASNLRTKSFQRALNKAVAGGGFGGEDISGVQRVALMAQEKEFLKLGGVMMQEMISLQRTVTDLSVREEMDLMDVEVGEVDTVVIDAVLVDDSANATTTPPKPSSSSSKQSKGKRKSEIKSAISAIQELTSDILRLELDFVRAVIEVMGPERANGIRAALVGNIDGGGGEALAGGLLRTLTSRPLSTVLDTLGYATAPDERAVTPQMSTDPLRNVFVTDFPGDVTASQVELLREEVTAIIRSAKPGDEALIVLQSGGGTVTGYGLAAAQLKRFTEGGMKLTICVEQVAASGGYMMCCVADKIVASPFAVLGSIGVIGEVPNFYERLKKEGIEFQTVTAGKFKRTLTPTKKITQEDIDKQKKDLEGILRLFKAFVKKNRPSLDIDDVATGETWFGEDAMAKGLCDEIKTVDDVLSEYVDIGHNVYDVKYNPVQELNVGALSGLLPGGERQRVGAARASAGGGVVRTLTRLLLDNIVPVVREEIMAELEGQNSYMAGTNDDIRNRYMIRDPNDEKDNIRIE